LLFLKSGEGILMAIERSAGKYISIGRPQLRPDRMVLRLNAAMALTVWLLWLAVGRGLAISSIEHYWRISVTMVFGSLVGGGTSEGGGAVAFPVFTKVLHIPAPQARLFTYAIQSIGMSAASLAILYLRVPIERRFLRFAAPAGVAGVILSAALIAPSVRSSAVRIFFTVMLTSLALALIIQDIRKVEGYNQEITLFGPREQAIAVATGFAGGIVSGVLGVGENMVAFIIIVMLFRVSEKVVTPTTVILMTVVSIAGFLTHILVLGDFKGVAPRYWLAAVPIVVVGAPLGALICSKLSRQVIRIILICLIAWDFISTLLLVPMSTLTLAVAASVLAAGTTGIYLMTRITRYQPARSPVHATEAPARSAYPVVPDRSAGCQ
jgi:uncharacterized protein